MTWGPELRLDKVLKTWAVGGRFAGTLLQHFSRSSQTRPSISSEDRSGIFPDCTIGSTLFSLQL